jgi:peptide methionine sulfoxide reductase MsrA
MGQIVPLLHTGLQYSSAIFVEGDEQKLAAEESLKALEEAHR